jgi:hypothetical protein
MQTDTANKPTPLGPVVKRRGRAGNLTARSIRDAPPRGFLTPYEGFSREFTAVPHESSLNGFAMGVRDRLKLGERKRTCVTARLNPRKERTDRTRGEPTCGTYVRNQCEEYREYLLQFLMVELTVQRSASTRPGAGDRGNRLLHTLALFRGMHVPWEITRVLRRGSPNQRFQADQETARQARH